MALVLDNPILQGYITGLQMREQQQAAVDKKEQHKVENELAKEKLKSYQEHLKAQTEHEKAKLDMEAHTHRLNALDKMTEMVSQGRMDIPKVTEQLPSTPNPISTPGMPSEIPNINQYVKPGTMVGDPGSYQFPATMFRSKQDQMSDQLAFLRQKGEVEGEQAVKTAGATAQAVLPAKKEEIVAHTAGQKEVMDIKTKADIEAARVKAVVDLEKVNRTIEGKKAVQAMANAGKLAAAKVKGEIPDSWISTNASLAATGNLGRVLGSNPKIDMPTKDALMNAGYKEFAAKDRQSLEQLHNLEPVMEKVDEYIKLLPDNAFGLPYAALKKKFPTELKNLRDIIESQSLTVGKGLEGESGRVTNQMMHKVDELLGTSGTTKAMAQSRVDFMKQQIRVRAMDQYMGGMSSKQKLLVLRTYDFDPAKFNKSIDVGGKQVPVFHKDKDGEWLYLDPKKGGYVSMD